jgi:hypothetical protein
MKRFLIIISSCFLLLTLSPSLMAAIYYVRIDGGDAQQCDGTTDAPYPGSGTGQPCAWAHPFWALDGSGNWKIQGGDAIIINSGSYVMGYGAPNSGWCESDGAFECHLPALPSGTLQSPTRILGNGWDAGCANPPELWGTQRAYYVLDLEGTSHAAIECLEITDHSGCVEDHSNPAIACERDNYPFGDWADTGIYASDSSNIVFKNLNIHGLSNTGVRAGRLSDWTVEDVRLAGNGLAGWDGDIDGNDSNSGTLTFRRWTVEWNGCAETYPGGQPGNCWAQTAGGYGDGVGTGLTGGHWVIEDSIFRYNTSDGLDLLYVREPDTQIEIKRTTSYGNAGNQIKVNGSTMIENSLIVGNCGYFNSKSLTYHVDDCRAGGNALTLYQRPGTTVSVVNSTVVGHGDCLAIVVCDETSVCDGNERIIILNNIFQGYQDFEDPTDTTCYFFFDLENYYQIQMDYNVVYNTKQSSYPPVGSDDIFQDPLFVNSNLETFDGHLQAGSPAIDSGLPVGSLSGLIPSHDIDHAARPYGTGVDRGAYEYSSALISLPGSQQSFIYPPSVAPVLHTMPSQAQPIGVGSVATGGDTLSLEIGLNQFSGPVDIYLAIAAPDLVPDLYIIKPDLALQPVSMGLEPWRATTSGPVNEKLYGDISISSLPPATYYLYIAVTPAGSLIEPNVSFYFWTTSFVIP